MLDVLDPSKPLNSKNGEIDDSFILLSAKFSLKRLYGMFVKNGGSPIIENLRNENCLHMACMLTSSPIVRAELVDLILSFSGLNNNDRIIIDKINIDGNTALHLASSNGLIHCAQKLITNGASLTIENNQNEFCCDVADKNDHQNLGTMLEIALIYRPSDERSASDKQINKVFEKNKVAKIILDSSSLTIENLTEFMNQSIKFISFILDENAARAEVLLTLYNWDCRKLKNDYDSSKTKVLNSAHLLSQNDHTIENGYFFLFIIYYYYYFINIKNLLYF
jgi:ankyrin repeat protein